MRVFILLIGLVFLSGCQDAPHTVRLSGKTMGTTYNILAVIDNGTNKNDLHDAIKKTLSRVNRHLSNWDKDSEVSAFNRSTSTTPQKISDMFVHVLDAANEIHRQSDGYFDLTLGPVIDLWGFGARKPNQPVPSSGEIEAALKAVGQGKHLALNQDEKTLAKRHPETSINLSAIAKGYGVDAVAATVRGFGLKDFMIEIGGDLTTSGAKQNGEDWRIGIEKPDQSGRSVQFVVKMGGRSLATSGDYRNYFEKNGKRYSHILNANTGRPISHKTASVSVIADTATLADGWATALLAAGEVEGMKIATKHHLAAYFIVRQSDSGEKVFRTSMSPKFAELFGPR